MKIINIYNPCFRSHQIFKQYESGTYFKGFCTQIPFIPILTYFDPSKTPYFNFFRNPLVAPLSLQKVGSKSPLFTRKKILFIITPGIFYSYGLCRICRSSHAKRQKRSTTNIFPKKTPKPPKNPRIPAPHYIPHLIVS